MMKYVACLLIGLFCQIFSLQLHGQVVVKGRIMDEQGQGISSANVMIVKNFTKPGILCYALTDDKGNYILKCNIVGDSLYILVKGFNIAPIERKIENKSCILDVKAKEKAIEIKEVVVKSRRLWENKDTLNYLVSSFKSAHDANIGDVLKKLPGIRVAESGRIEYNGMPISKFYIEGMDLLKKRYGIATNNISPDDIATIQVLEHHQSVKALKKIEYSNQAAINLKLKESAKGIFSLVSLLGGGYSNSWLGEGEVFASYFSRKHQNLVTYKVNNSGKDIEKEIQDYNSSNTIEALTRIQEPEVPDIEKSRYYNNQSQVLTANNIIKNKKGNEWNIGVYYFNDIDKKQGYSSISYMMPDGTLNVIDETLSTRMRTNRLMGDGSYEVNTDNVFLQETLKYQFEWQDGRGLAVNEKDINQYADYKMVDVSNKLKWVIKKDEYSGWRINSIINFKNNPQKLTVIPCLFDDLFAGEEADQLHQTIRLTHFDTKNSIAMLSAFRIGKIRVNPELLANIDYDRLNSNLTGSYGTGSDKLLENEKMENNSTLLNFRTDVAAAISYNSDVFNLSVDLPVIFNGKSFKQKLQELSVHRTKCLFEPNAQLAFLWGKWELALGYQLLSYGVGIGQLYDGYILGNYRNLSSYEPDLSDGVLHYTSFNLNYKNVYAIFFANISANYSRSSTEVLYGQTFENNLSRLVTHKIHTNGDTFRAKIFISKGFDWKKLAMELHGLYANKNYARLRQGQVVRNLSEEVNINGKLHCEPFTFLSMGWNGLWRKGWSRLKSGERFPGVSSLVNQVDCSVAFPYDISLSASYYNYYTDYNSGRKSFSLANLGLQYKWKSTRFYLEWNNIFDVRSYSYTSLNDLDRSYSSYLIRPSSVMFKVSFKIM